MQWGKSIKCIFLFKNTCLFTRYLIFMNYSYIIPAYTVQSPVLYTVAFTLFYTQDSNLDWLSILNFYLNFEAKIYIFLTFILSNFFVRTLQNFCFAHEKLKKNPQKKLRNTFIDSLTDLWCPYRRIHVPK